MSRFLQVLAILFFAFVLFRANSGDAVTFPQTVLSEATPAEAVPADRRIRVLLFTGTGWCGACQHLDRSVVATPAWKEFSEKEIRFRSVDLPADRSKAPPADLSLAKRFRVTGYPTMIVLDGKSEELSRQVGSGPPVENYKAWIRQHARFY